MTRLFIVLGIIICMDGNAWSLGPSLHSEIYVKIVDGRCMRGSPRNRKVIRWPLPPEILPQTQTERRLGYILPRAKLI
jgi:hypothetical protein